MTPIPERLAKTCRHTLRGPVWLATELPKIIQEVSVRWNLQLQAPFDHADVSCAWVAPAQCSDGSEAVLKIGYPHFESKDEIAGLRFWNGRGTVRLLQSDEELDAFLMERCDPGTSLRTLPEEEQDVVIAQALRRLWTVPQKPYPFRSLSELIQSWSVETAAAADGWFDHALVLAGLDAFEHLIETSTEDVLLATDLHAGNILRAQREPWLVIDPKPFVGDPAYDVTQHILNCRERLAADPFGLLARLAELTGVSFERLRLWTFARAAADPRRTWQDDPLHPIARALAP
jgi:streptomycin 6-kinase